MISSRSNTYRMWQITKTWLKSLIANKSCHFIWDLYSDDCCILLISFLTIRCLSLLIKGWLHLYSLLSLLGGKRSILFHLPLWFKSAPQRYTHYLCIFNNLIPSAPEWNIYVQYLIDQRFFLVWFAFKLKGRCGEKLIFLFSLWIWSKKPQNQLPLWNTSTVEFQLLFMHTWDFLCHSLDPAPQYFKRHSVLHSLKSFIILSLTEPMELQLLYVLADS